MLRPTKICLDASTVCQLKCRSCPTSSGETGRMLGSGFLRFDDFRELMEKNPRISLVELSNWGEIFLNKELGRIIEYAFKHNIALTASNGVNMNHVSGDILEKMVKYRFRKLTCSIDGVDQKTYSTYRVNGDLGKVLENIRTINRLKKAYNSFYPVLGWLFVVFGHNEHQIPEARKMARDFDMSFSAKLSWDDLYTETFSPVKDTELVAGESGIGAGNRQEYRERYGKEYMSKVCHGLWVKPQINYDGRLLGCTVNYWDDYGNVFDDGLLSCMNNEKISYARDMLMGRKEEKEGIPCISCRYYKLKKENDDWIKEKDIGGPGRRNRTSVMIENRLFKYGPVNSFAGAVYRAGK